MSLWIASMPTATCKIVLLNPPDDDPCVAGKMQEWSDKQFGDRVSSSRNFDLVTDNDAMKALQRGLK
jgi:hypothetical protein